VTSGEYFLGVASTEPSGGSDVAGEKTLARRVGDKYVVNGEKTYISGVGEAHKGMEGASYCSPRPTQSLGTRV